MNSSNRSSAAWLLWFLLLVGCGSNLSSDAPPPNLLLISIDTLRADHMSLYGYERNTTPHLDEFFSEQIIFEKVASPAPCTTPAVKQFLSGDFDAQNPRLAELLKESGYQTAAVVSQHLFRLLNQTDRFTAGFDHWDIQPAQQTDRHGMSARSATEVTDRALAWLKERDAEQPFFLWLHYFDPHLPYAPPKEFRRWPTPEGKYEGGDPRVPLEKDHLPERKWQHSGEIFTQADIDRYVNLYDAEILFTDAEVHRFLQAMEQAGLLEETLVVLTSDHGESLGEGFIWDHCQTLREVETRVPLAFHFPAESKPRQVATASRVSTLDLYPTILNHLGLEFPVDTTDGRDLFAPVGQQKPIAISGFRRQVAIRQDAWKLVASRQGAGYRPLALFQLTQDPGEQQNLINRKPKVAQRLFQQMAATYLKFVNEREAADDQTLERLKKLGYTE
jgi:arylsulfatase